MADELIKVLPPKIPGFDSCWIKRTDKKKINIHVKIFGATGVRVYYFDTGWIEVLKKSRKDGKEITQKHTFVTKTHLFDNWEEFLEINKEISYYINTKKTKK